MLKQMTLAAVLAMTSGVAMGQDLLGGKSPEAFLASYTEGAAAPKFEMPTLNIGDEAPAFKVDTWIKGTPISGFEKGNVYLIDFWATWCGPCIAIMPHLTELQAERADEGLRVVGVSIWESGSENGQRVPLQGEKQAEHVRKFVDKNDAKMGYTVGTGDKEFEQTWMMAAHQSGIPTVMIVDREGKIGWIGYGTDPALGENLDAILAGTQDHKAAHEARIEAMRAEHAQSSGPNYAAIFGELVESKSDEAAAFAQALTETVYKGDANVYNSIAWAIVEDEGWSPEAVKLAVKLATDANEATGWEIASVLDTLAWAQYRSGDAAAAIETEKKAIAALRPEEKSQMLADFEEALKTFGAE